MQVMKQPPGPYLSEVRIPTNLCQSIGRVYRIGNVTLERVETSWRARERFDRRVLGQSVSERESTDVGRVWKLKQLLEPWSRIGDLEDEDDCSVRSHWDLRSGYELVK